MAQEAFSRLPTAQLIGEVAVAAVKAEADASLLAPLLYKEARLLLLDYVTAAADRVNSEGKSEDAPKLTAEDVIRASVMSGVYGSKSIELSRRLAADMPPLDGAAPSAGVHNFVEDLKMTYLAAADSRYVDPCHHHVLSMPFSIINTVAQSIQHGTFISNTTFAPRCIWEQSYAKIAGISLKKDALSQVTAALKRFHNLIGRDVRATPDQFNVELQIFVDALGRTRELLKPLITMMEARLLEERTKAVQNLFQDGTADAATRDHRSASDAGAPPHDESHEGTSAGEASGTSSVVNDSSVSDTPIMQRSPALGPEETPTPPDTTELPPSTDASTTAPTAHHAGGKRFSFLKNKFGGGASAPAAAKPPAHPKTEESGAADSTKRGSFLQRAIQGISKGVSKTAQALNMSATASTSLTAPDLLAYAQLILGLHDALLPLQSWVESTTYGSLLQRLPPATSLPVEMNSDIEYLTFCANQLAIRHVHPSILRILAYLAELAQLLMADVESLVIRNLQMQSDRYRRSELPG